MKPYSNRSYATAPTLTRRAEELGAERSDWAMTSELRHTHKQTDTHTQIGTQQVAALGANRVGAQC